MIVQEIVIGEDVHWNCFSILPHNLSILFYQDSSLNIVIILAVGVLFVNWFTCVKTLILQWQRHQFWGKLQNHPVDNRLIR